MAAKAGKPLQALRALHEAGVAAIDELRSAMDAETPGSAVYKELIAALQAAAGVVDRVESITGRIDDLLGPTPQKSA